MFGWCNKRITILIVAIVMLFGSFGVTNYRARAFEPISMMLLAPVALKIAEFAEPHAMRAMKYSGKHGLKVGQDVIEIFCLPLGAVAVTAGAPFGFMKSGFKWLKTGFCAPFKLAFHLAMFPVALCGANVP